MANGVAGESAAPGGVLARFACVVSRDLDEVRSGVGRVFCEHRLRVAGAPHGLNVSHPQAFNDALLSQVVEAAGACPAP